MESKEVEIVKIQQWRCSVKKFDSAQKIPTSTWKALEESLVLSPSSYGLQPWKFLIVTDDAVKKQLTPHSWNQTQVGDCSHFIVFTYRNVMDEKYVSKYMKAIAEIRKVPVEKLEGFKKSILGDVVTGPRSSVIKEWAARQVYIALGNFMTTAAILGVDTCPMEGIDPPKFDEILGLSGSEYSTVVACAAGYRHADDVYSKLAKVRFSTDEIIQHI